MTHWRTLRVFISSTFRDMHAERDYLVRAVFPELRERCARRRLHLVDVDLRWGLTEEEAERGRVLEICLDEIERCRPFFVGILGERYGWIVPPDNVPEDSAYSWLRELGQQSVTALEIYHGVLNSPHLRTRSFFYFRDPGFIPGVPAELRSAFLPESDDAARKLAALKSEIRRQSPVFENYPCSYAGERDGKATLGGLEAFGQRVLDDLWSAVNQEFPAEESPPGELEIEGAFHEAFVEGRVQRFVGRADLLRRLTDHASRDGAVPLVLTGATGSGKSALLARFARDYARDHPETFVLSHFIGASPGSTDIRRTLVRLCRELDRQFAFDAMIPDDYQELWQEFHNILERSGRSRRVLLLIDALDQLGDEHDPQALHWLPTTLPTGVCAIVSTLEGGFLEALRRRTPAPCEAQVSVLSDHERREIVRLTLADYRKQLDERPQNDQLGRLLAKTDANNPLYLVIACEELRLFGEFERVTARIDDLPVGIEELLGQVLERLETDLGAELVRDALSLLECSRHGLLEIEMLQLLRREGEEQLPRAVWARLYRGLRFYLRPTSDVGEGMLDFFHRQLARAVRQRYLTRETESAIHARLARFFRSRIDPGGNRQWGRDCPRALTELPHHLLHAGHYQDLFLLARDASFADLVASLFSSEPSVLLELAQKAIEGAAILDDAAAMAEFVLSHARRRGETATESPLHALRRGEIERAWELADLQPAERCALWHLLLAWELKDAGRVDQRRATLDRLAQRELPRLRHSTWTSRCAVPLLARAGAGLNPALQTIRRNLLDSDDLENLCHGLAVEGDAAAAREIVDEFPQQPQRERGHRRIAQGQVERARRYAIERDFAHAVDTAGELVDVQLRATALCEIARRQADIGLRDAARAHIDVSLALVRGDKTPVSAETLRDIAAAQASAGYGHEAHATFRTAADAALAPGLEDARDKSIAGVIPTLVRFGEFDIAIELARAVTSEWKRGEMFRTIVSAQLQRDDTASAAATTRLIARDEDRLQALCLVALAHTRAGAREAAASSFEAALALAPRVKRLQDGGQGLCDVACAQIQAGLEADGRATFDRAIEEARARPKGERLRRLAVSLARARLFDRAIELANEITNENTGEIDCEDHRIPALAAIASDRWKAGGREMAVPALRDLIDQAEAISIGSKVGAFSAIARTYLDNDDFPGAVAVVGRAHNAGWSATEQVVYGVFGHPPSFDFHPRKSVEDARQARWILASLLGAMQSGEATNDEARAEVLHDLAKAQAERGEIDTALHTARQVPEGFFSVRQAPRGYYRGGALGACAFARARAAQFEDALAIVSEISDTERRAAATGLVAAELARAGHFERACDLARGLERWKRRDAMRAIAQAMAELGEFGLAEETVGEDPVQLMLIREDIAKRQSAGGDRAGARATFARAAEAATLASSDKDAATKAYYTNSWLTHVADAQAASGFTDDAHETLLLAREAGLRCMLAADIKTDHERGMAASGLNWLVEKWARLGRVEYAIGTVELMRTHQRIWDRWVRTKIKGEAVIAIVIAQAAAGDLEAAHASAEGIELPNVRADALKQLALAEGRARLGEAAHRHLANAVRLVVETVSDDDRPKGVAQLAEFAVAYREVGLLDSAKDTAAQALAMARGTPRDDYRSKGLQSTAVLQAKLGDLAGASATLREIVMEHNRRGAQGEIAAILARSGFALEAVRTIEATVIDRGAAFVELAGVFVERCDREGLKRMLVPCAHEDESACRVCLSLAVLYPDQLDGVTEQVALAVRGTSRQSQAAPE